MKAARATNTTAVAERAPNQLADRDNCRPRRRLIHHATVIPIGAIRTPPNVNSATTPRAITPATPAATRLPWSSAMIRGFSTALDTSRSRCRRFDSGVALRCQANRDRCPVFARPPVIDRRHPDDLAIVSVFKPTRVVHKTIELRDLRISREEITTKRVFAAVLSERAEKLFVCHAAIPSSFAVCLPVYTCQLCKVEPLNANAF
jgi:hypothetical protein